MVSNSLFTIPELTTTAQNQKCALGWIESEGKCYKTFQIYKDQLTWFEAEAFCKNLAVGGHLSSFSSLASVNTVLSLYFSNPIWIGLNKIDSDSGYKWIDGSPADFFNWDINQPSDLNGVENCVEMSKSGKWTDRACYTNKGWSCTIEKGITPANINPNQFHNETYPSKFI